MKKIRTTWLATAVLFSLIVAFSAGCGGGGYGGTGNTVYMPPPPMHSPMPVHSMH
jgi:hypothetical protein